MFKNKAETITIILLSVVLSLIINQIFFNPKSKQDNLKDELTNDIFDIQVKPVYIPESINFAGENVPLNLYYVREHLEWELTVNTYWHSSTLLNLKRTKRWFPVIEPILKANNIPEDFKYLSLIESGFQNVTSPKGAIGFWQFLKGTAKDYGLEVNSEIDERYHVEKSTEAACKYLNKAYKKYNNWTIVAASYNAGTRGIDRQIERQKETNYYDLLLNEETERYVFRILALKAIVTTPDQYGFELAPDDFYQPIPFQTEVVKTSVNSWADFAKERNLSYRLIKEFNPWLRQPDLKNRQSKTYQIKIPDVKVMNSVD